MENDGVFEVGSNVRDLRVRCEDVGIGARECGADVVLWDVLVVVLEDRAGMRL